MKKFEEIIAEMQNPSNPSVCPWFAGRLDVAHKREVDALKRRCAELDAEIAAKDEVIKRLNDAIAEEQRRKMATSENSSAVGDAAKLREVAEFVAHIDDNGYTSHDVQCAIDKARAALAAPARNCDTKESIDAVVKRFKAENCDHYDNAIDDPRTQCHQNCVECVIKWIMANRIKEETK